MKKAELKELESTIRQSTDIPEHTRNDLIAKIDKAKSPLDTDTWIYRLVVASLGLAVLACVTFSFLVTIYNTDPNKKMDMPEIFIAIGSAAVGALAGLLAPSPRKSENE
jgi:hypothetical protein